MHTDGVYYDGEIAKRREVRLQLADALEICEGEKATVRWPYAAIRLVDESAGVTRLRCEETAELARLEIRDCGFAAALRGRCAAVGYRSMSNRDLGRILFWSLAAGASLIGVALYGVPRVANSLTPLVPAALEARLGDAAAKQVEYSFSGKPCGDAAGKAALQGLVDHLAEAGGLPALPPVIVIKTAIPNAFALPGGRVYVLSALIDKAETPDELGGVLAHELGHVAHRDGLRLMISNGGVAFLFSLLFGDVTGAGAVIFASRTLIQTAHSREAEAAADAYAATLLHKLGRSSAPLGQFLLRMTGAGNRGALALLATHPASQDRLAALKRDDRAADGAALLDDAAWSAIRHMCASESAP
jgi:Zn-dependent protease with chaperone function